MEEAPEAFPPPPPPVLWNEPSSRLGTLLAVGGAAAAFGPSWQRLVPGDWLVAAGAATAGAWLCALAAPGRWRAAGAALTAAAAACLYEAGSLPGASSPAFEAVVVWALCGVAALAGANLAFWGARAERPWGLLLLALSMAGQAAASLSRLAAVAPLWADWKSSGGLWRWGGPLALAAVLGARKLTEGDLQAWSRRTNRDGSLVNWNR